MRILIVDDEYEIAELLEFLVQSEFPEGTQTTLAESGNSAIKILSESNDIDICICDHNMPNGMGSDVLKYIIDTKSDVKFVLCSTVVPSDSPKEYPKEHVFHNIQKPDIAAGVDGLYSASKKLLSERSIYSVDEFVPISLHVLSLIGKAPADIYIRMSVNKFVKCINQGELFSNEDQKKYNIKSVDELFIKKSDYDAPVKHVILEMVHDIMDRRKLSLSEKMSITHAQLVGMIKFTGITPDMAEASKKNIQQSVNFLMKSPIVSDFWKDMNLTGEFPSKLYTLHSLLSSVVTKKLQWSSEATTYKLTLSAFLQDISLNSIRLMELCDYQDFLENEARFTRDEIRKYKEHPKVSSEMSKSFKDIPPDIDRILLEQHEMPDGNGFPRNLNANQLGPLTCTFIITGIFARHILRDGNSFDVVAFANYLENRGYSRGNFKDPFNIIKSYGA